MKKGEWPAVVGAAAVYLLMGVLSMGGIGLIFDGNPWLGVPLLVIGVLLMRWAKVKGDNALKDHNRKKGDRTQGKIPKPVLV